MANSFVYYNSIGTRHICVDNVVTKYYCSSTPLGQALGVYLFFCTFVLGTNFIVVWQNSNSWTHVVSWFFKHAGEEVDFYFWPQWGCITLLKSKKIICAPRSSSLKLFFLCLNKWCKNKNYSCVHFVYSLFTFLSNAKCLKFVEVLCCTLVCSRF
jgi:hypothetical protein